MICPICTKTLSEIQPGGYSCPTDDGILITGGYLANKDRELAGEVSSLEADTPEPVAQRETDLTCPHCSNPMNRVNYDATGIIIDSCPHCSYRWLDRGEFQKIIEFKPDIASSDRLFLVGLDDKIKALKVTDMSNSNPNIPLTTGLAGGIIRGSVAGDSRRTISYLLTAGLYGLIVGMIKSKFMRIVGPIILLGFIILGYLIYKQVHAVNWTKFPL